MLYLMYEVYEVEQYVLLYVVLICFLTCIMTNFSNEISIFLLIMYVASFTGASINPIICQWLLKESQLFFEIFSKVIKLKIWKLLILQKNDW